MLSNISCSFTTDHNLQVLSSHHQQKPWLMSVHRNVLVIWFHSLVPQLLFLIFYSAHLVLVLVVLVSVWVSLSVGSDREI